MSTITDTVNQFAFFIEEGGTISYGTPPTGTTTVVNPKAGHYRVQFEPIADVIPIVTITADTTNLGSNYVVTTSVQNVDTNSLDIYIQNLSKAHKNCGLNVMMTFIE